MATESYDFEGKHSRFFLNDWNNSSVYKADFVNSSTVIVSGVNLASTHNPVLLLVNQTVVAELSDSNDAISFATSGADTNVTATNQDGGIAFVSGDRVRVVVSGSGNTFNQLPSTPDGLGGVRGGHTDIYLYNPAGNMEKTLRVQSCSIDGDLSRETLVEMGSKKAYFQRLERPIDVSITIEVNETDLEEYAKLVGQEAAYDAGTLREINPDDFLRNNVLEVMVYKDEFNHTFANEPRLREVFLDRGVELQKAAKKCLTQQFCSCVLFGKGKAWNYSFLPMQRQYVYNIASYVDLFTFLPKRNAGFELSTFGICVNEPG